MIKVAEVMNKITDDQLKTAYSEILDWRETNQLKESGVVARIYCELEIRSSMKISFSAIEHIFLSEMAKRYYR